MTENEADAYLTVVEGWLRDNRGIVFTEGAVDDLCYRIALEIGRLRTANEYAFTELTTTRADNARLRGIEQFGSEASRHEIEGLRADNARLEEALERIEQWSRAYPLEIFPEPDLKRARELLEAGGMTLDAISAHAMRHVVEGVGDIARRALEPKP